MLAKKLLFTTAVATLWIGIQPNILSAQTTGVGADGLTRVLWRATDGSVSLWRVNANLDFLDFHNYGPFDGWTPLVLTTSSLNRSYLLWRNTAGLVAVWWLDANMNFVSQELYGPFYGWIGETLSVSPLSPYNLRLTWKNTNGTLAIWTLDASAALLNTRAYGPAFGYDPGPAAAAAKSKLPASDADARAAEAMNNPVSRLSGPMPK